MHDSHDEPVNPVGQTQVPDAEQVAEPEHDGEHEADWRESNESEPESADVGNWAISGIGSQMTVRTDPEDDETSAKVLAESVSESAERGVEELALVFPTGMNAVCPPNNDSVNVAIPG